MMFRMGFPDWNETVEDVTNFGEFFTCEVRRISIPRTTVNSASTKVGYTESLASRKEISMRQEQVAEVMNDPLSQELLHSAIPGSDSVQRYGRVPACDPDRVPLE
jgi:hypothetical protein